MARRMKSVREMREQMQRIKSTADYLRQRDVYGNGDNAFGFQRFTTINQREDRASHSANVYASRILGRTTYNALSYSRFNNPNDSKRYTSRFYMSRASG